jgi:alkyl sulfatase BDS1-like metallo-beta-lactamase superfamily hydrolase
MMRHPITGLLAAAAALIVPTSAFSADADTVSKPASAATRAAIDKETADLPWQDREDFDLASRGFMAAVPGNKIYNDKGALIRNLDESALYDQSAPTTTNPSLWRNAQLLSKAGLFKVSDRIYQVRGVELANMTLVLGKTGFIIIDTLTTTESAKAALALARSKLGDKPVVGIIYTHSHIDHYGGTGGIMTPAEAKARNIPIVAPEGFMKEVISENVIAGPAMTRRSIYAFGHILPLDATGAISAGIGPSFARNGLATGSVSLVAPTVDVTHSGQTMTIDGVAIEFQMTPGTEAPAEMNVYFPELRALSMAENANGSLHNILTLRGAQVRDAKAWADAMTETLRLYGGRTDVEFASHFWPHWGQAKIVDFLSSQRDTYKYLHDQSVRMMNMGLNGTEIAEKLTLPQTLAKRWFNRGYYGSLSHNSKAVYQRYMGWYDGNPASLNPLPPEQAAARYVTAMGGGAAVLAMGTKAIAAGDYRWATELLSRLTFAEPSNRAAQLALADSLEQQGYAAESSMWRNIYLSGAAELRAGGPKPSGFDSVAGSIPTLPLASILDLLAVRLVPEKAKPLAFDLVLDGGAEAERVEVRNGTLIHMAIKPDDAKNAIALSRPQLVAAVTKKPGGDVLPPASAARMDALMAMVEAPAGGFGLVTAGP